jgi:Ca-activated chloride channel family protein
MSGVLTTAVPIQELGSTTHQFDIRAEGPSTTLGAGLRTEIALADSERWSGNRDVVLRYRLAGAEITSGLLLYQGGDENFFLLMAQPPQAVEPDQVPPREYVFVVDVSGSMHGFPLDTAKKLMTDLAGVLKPTDAFNVVLFADGSDRFSAVSVPATRANLARALRFVGQRPGGGGTRLLNALQDAVAIQRQPGVSRSVVLVTDGYIDAESAVFDYIRDQRDEVNFFAFGIGGSVNRFLIEGVAKAGLGEPFIVTQPEEAADAAARLRRYIDTPVLTGIGVTFTGFEVYDVDPSTIPDLFASRPIVVIGKWRGPAVGSIEISGRTGRGLYQTSIPVSAAPTDANPRALRQLWARTRIADLSDFGPSTPNEERVAAITSLGLTYSLLTRYTSFVAVQEVVRRTTADAVDVDQPLPIPAGVSDLAVGVTSGSEPDIMWLAAILVASLACVSVMRRWRRSGVSV